MQPVRRRLKIPGLFRSISSSCSTKSGSINCPASDNACEKPANTISHPTRWEAVTTAINSFVNAPTSAGTGVGIGFFSLADNACTVANYAKPRVAISALPANAAPITGAIGNEMPSGSTPTVPALQGSINYAASYMKTPQVDRRPWCS